MGRILFTIDDVMGRANFSGVHTRNVDGRQIVVRNSRRQRKETPEERSNRRFKNQLIKSSAVVAAIPAAVSLLTYAYLIGARKKGAVFAKTHDAQINFSGIHTRNVNGRKIVVRNSKIRKSREQERGRGERRKRALTSAGVLASVGTASTYLSYKALRHALSKAR